MRIIVLILAVVALASCRSTRNIQTAINKKDTGASVTATSISKVDTALLIKNTLSRLDSNHLEFTTFSSKVDVDYRGGNDKHYDVNATIRMYKDSTIWVSVNAALGIEAMRLLITRDSLFMLDKLNKTYTARSVDYLQEVTALPLTLSILQNLLLGNPVFTDNNVVAYSNNLSDNTVSLLSAGRWFKNLLTLNAVDYTLAYSKLDDVDITRIRTADLSYSDYENKRGKLFSTKRRIRVADKSRLDVSLNFKQYDFNGDVSFPFSVPKNYKRR